MMFSVGRLNFVEAIIAGEVLSVNLDKNYKWDMGL